MDFIYSMPPKNTYLNIVSVTYNLQTFNLSYINNEASMNFATPLVYQYVQVIVQSADNVALEKSMYIGLQVEFYGCFRSSAQSSALSCVAGDTEEIWGDRQILSFGFNSVIFCHYSPKKLAFFLIEK